MLTFCPSSFWLCRFNKIFAAHEIALNCTIIFWHNTSLIVSCLHFPGNLPTNANTYFNMFPLELQMGLNCFRHKKKTQAITDILIFSKTHF